ncbi:DUF2341 domain-containing protein [Thermococcus sp. CX2]|uniref:DUF2341 domain-containing protein n=1 Tax=Thermococcus sp. CX2 TaxID=163006 RepID=UPI001439FD7B|nr:DUF2341 domain-containing protein [Thermococcus sp. CX2]NJE85872.1 DUF2341 domain-containing protein [Thermococcus sp. CX2]
MRKLKLTPLIISLMLLLATFGLAVPNINVSVQGLGWGAGPVQSPATEGGVTFHFATLTQVDYSLVHVSRSLPAYTAIIVKIYDSRGNIVALGNTTLQASLPAGEDVRVNVSFTWNRFSNVTVVIKSPNFTTSFSGPISLKIQAVGEGVWVGSLRRPINITEQSGTDLYNYTVRIVLGGQYTNAYFTDLNGNPLYYWYVYDGSFTIFWVKIPYLSANSKTTIFLHYGGSVNPYLSYMNPAKVFLFFDDFTGTYLDTSKWNIYGTPTVSGGILSLQGYRAQGRNIRGQATWIWTVNTFPVSYVIEMNTSLADADLRIAQNYGYAVGPFFLWYINSTGDGYGEGIGIYYSLPVIGLLQINVNNGSGTWTITAWNLYTMGTWSIISIVVDRGNIQTYQDGNPISTYTVPSLEDGSIGLGQATGGPSQYDWILVRKYVDPEPAVSIGWVYADLVFRP